MDGKKARQEISLIGRIFSLELFIAVMGAASLVSGIVTRRPATAAVGLLLLAAILALNLACKRWVRR
jgi:hypothetical protein